MEGIPKPELLWDKNGVELSIENFQREFTARSYPIQSNLTKYTLTARDVTASLSGNYHCNASNALGTSSSEFNVTVLSKYDWDFFRLLLCLYPKTENFALKLGFYLKFDLCLRQYPALNNTPRKLKICTLSIYFSFSKTKIGYKQPK